MLYTIMKSLRNFFVQSVHERDFNIVGGRISLFVPIDDEQYYLIEGSLKNDGLHKGADVLKDEQFTGAISLLKIPQDFLNLALEIETFIKNNPESAYVSESFGGYSYSKANQNGKAITWKDVFKSKLDVWRKI